MKITRIGNRCTAGIEQGTERMTLHVAGSGSRLFALLLVACSGILATTTAARSDDSLDLADYEGKVVVVDFWASWCVPCRRSFPWLDAMQEKYADQGLVVVGVNVDSNEEDARAFLDEYPVSFRIVSDPNGNLARQFDVVAMPSSYIIGRDGEVVTTHFGFKVRKQDDYESVLRETLGAG
jgi:cytochrome c biogenesis protein CcmG/thiol:disulfide interchange protein DsbE